jgi:hypothetical protein
MVTYCGTDAVLSSFTIILHARNGDEGGLAVQSRLVMDGVGSEAARLVGPDLADLFVRREAL